MASDRAETVARAVAGEAGGEADVLVERPLAEGWSWTAKPFVREADGAVDAALSLGVKRGWRFGPAAAALQASALADEASPCGPGGAEARALVGAGMALSARTRAFVNAEAGRRSFEGGCGASVGELTLGLERPGSLWLAQAFAYDPGRDDVAIKAQASFVWFFRHDFGVELGVRDETSDDGGTAVLIGLWSRR